MKAALIGKASFPKGSDGLSTVEILIALTLLILSLSGAILIVFGNQTMVLDAYTGQEALTKSEQNLIAARIKSFSDYHTLYSQEISIDDIYSSHLVVKDITPCSKKVVSQTIWSNRLRNLKVDLSTIINSVQELYLLGNNCPFSGPGRDGGKNWQDPVVTTAVQIASLQNDITDLDIIQINGKNYAFLVADFDPETDNNSFWIIDISTSPPQLVAGLNTGSGLRAITVNKGANGFYYAYLAQNQRVDQLTIIEIDPNNLSTPNIVATYSLAIHGVDPEGLSPQARSIYFYDNMLYLGLGRTAGRELHIFDVTNPKDPQWLAEIEVNRNINNIAVCNRLVYLATGPGGTNNNPFKIFNVDPESENYLKETGSFITPVSVGQGQGLYLLGNQVYLGLASGNPNFYVLDITDPADIKIINSLNAGGSIGTVSVSGHLAFIGRNSNIPEAQIYDLSNPGQAKLLSRIEFSNNIRGIKYHHDDIYIALQNQNILNILNDQP